jgi:hypothetical protein
MMEEVKLVLNEHHRGHFFIEDNGEGVAAMQIGILENVLTVYHTEVLPDYEGKGLAKKLLTTMADYARKNNLKVVPFCPYVLAQFKAHPDVYADIRKK